MGLSEFAASDRRDAGWSVECDCTGPLHDWRQGTGVVGQAMAQLLPVCLATVADLAAQVPTAAAAARLAAPPAA